jgi:hypothetical protein
VVLQDAVDKAVGRAVGLDDAFGQLQHQPRGPTTPRGGGGGRLLPGGGRGVPVAVGFSTDAR